VRAFIDTVIRMLGANEAFVLNAKELGSKEPRRGNS